MYEMMFLLLLALVVVGPNKLPALARQAGKYLAQFKRASDDLRNQLRAEMLEIEQEERASRAPTNRPATPIEEPPLVPELAGGES